MAFKNRIVNLIYFLINSLLLKRSKVNYSGFKINGLLKIVNRGSIFIGDGFTANSGVNKNPIGGDTILRLIVFKEHAVLRIGRNAGISNSTIVCWEQIQIGDNVVIGGGTKIWDTNFHSLNPVNRMMQPDNDVKTAPIYIGNNVFIGANVIINKGITIGDNSIIAAGSVLNKSIPANVMAGGNPCKVIKELIF